MLFVPGRRAPCAGPGPQRSLDAATPGRLTHVLITYNVSARSQALIAPPADCLSGYMLPLRRDGLGARLSRQRQNKLVWKSGPRASVATDGAAVASCAPELTAAAMPLSFSCGGKFCKE